ncbi:MAG: hypothetical protein JW800_04285 [Candidatus Omnitrophica bacterium]|nr:hypothetical protein [Candidatus Omnitrophota bacterium]
MFEETTNQKQPIDYLKIVFRRKWLIILPTVIGIVGGVIAANVLPKVYRASTLILVEEGRIINPLIKDLAVSTSTSQRLAVLREQILGWDRINQLIQTLNLAKDVKTQLQFEDLVKGLRESIKVGLRSHDIVNISYDGQNPEKARDIVKTITDIFIAENLRQQNKETENAISFINDQLDLYQKKVKQAEVAQMEEKLNDLLVDSTDKHPMVIELRKKIDAARNEIEKGDYSVTESAVAEAGELDELKEELKSIKEELATASLDTSQGGANRARMASTTNDKLYKLLLLDKLHNMASAEDRGVSQKLYDTLLERLETAKITQSLEASKEGTRYTVLDPARIPLRAVKPKKMLVLLMGMFLGMCAGGGMVFGAEMLDRSFLGVDEAKDFLELPILGAISKIVTKQDLHVQKMRNVKISILSIIVGTGLVLMIIFNIVLNP